MINYIRSQRHGQVVADIARQTGRYRQVLFLDDYAVGKEVIGKCSDYMKFKDAEIEMYPAFVNNVGRVEWEDKKIEAGISLARIIHSLAYVSPQAAIAAGCIIMPYATVNIGIRIKKHV